MAPLFRGGTVAIAKTDNPGIVFYKPLDACVKLDLPNNELRYYYEKT